MEVLKLHYDRIIIDTPPVHPVSDALVMSSVVDGVIYVVKAGDTPASLVARGLKRLHDVQAPVVGTVLNHVDTRHKNRYGYYYSADYSSYFVPRSLPKASRKKTDLALPS
jgi:succinoglycan biosynthesis transport protein ExoP